ncbi:holo-ACP synthase [Bacillaceae bacterium W0354]
MIKGIGIDIIELKRIENLMNRQPKFIKRILTKREQETLNKLTNPKRKIEYVAGRFAAKEAYSKALGTGIGQELSFQTIEILTTLHGAPAVMINGEKTENIFVSISHSKDYAIAQIIIA